MLRSLLAALAAGAVLLCASVEAREVELAYVPPAAPVMGEAVITLGEAASGRENEPHDLGAIRGGYGNRLKSLETGPPVLDVVVGAVRAGLDARGLLATEAPRFRLDMRLVKFDCSQYQRREAHFHLTLMVVELATGELVYDHMTEVAEVSGSMMSLATGIFASVDDLRDTANLAMQNGVDRALDEPGFRAALSRPAPAVAESTPEAEAPEAAPETQEEAPAETVSPL